MPEPIEEEGRRWLDAVLAATGPLEFFDAHTHIGENDPDGYRQRPEDLIASLELAGSRAVVFPMCEPDGYSRPNDAALEAAAASGGRLVPFCRVDPRADPVAEARRCLDAGARGIKLHPRAEAFTMAEPAVADLVALAADRGLPILIHAGRGIPALGADTVRLAERHPGANLILAHAAVSDLAWLWREMPDHPNLFIDTSWWNPADLLALFSLVPPGQILWASDSPYGEPISSAAMQLRCALAAGLPAEAIASIAGAQIERLLDSEPAIDAGPPPGPGEALAPSMERVGSHLLTALGRVLGGTDPFESAALAGLACDLDDPELTGACAEILRLIDLARDHHGPPPPHHRYPRSTQFLMAALVVSRTPTVALPK